MQNAIQNRRQSGAEPPQRVAARCCRRDTPRGRWPCFPIHGHHGRRAYVGPLRRQRRVDQGTRLGVQDAEIVKVGRTRKSPTAEEEELGINFSYLVDCFLVLYVLLLLDLLHSHCWSLLELRYSHDPGLEVFTSFALLESTGITLFGWSLFGGIYILDPYLYLAPGIS